jgi:AraC-like DNA-binding protein
MKIPPPTSYISSAGCACLWRHPDRTIILRRSRVRASSSGKSGGQRGQKKEFASHGQGLRSRVIDCTSSSSPKVGLAKTRGNAHFIAGTATFMSVMPAQRQLLVASHLPSTLRIPLRTALGEEHRIAEAVNWTDLADIVRHRPVDLIVADPSADGGINVDAVSQMMEQFPRTPVIVYTSMAPKAVGAMAELSRRGLKDVVLHRYDDSPERFHRVIERAAKKRPGQHVLAQMGDTVDRLPAPIAAALEQVFERPQAFDSASDIADTAKVTLSTLYRSLNSVGFRSPRRILIAARVLRAHTYMREPGYSVREVADKLGYSNPRILARHTYLTLGIKPRHLRHRMSDEAIVGRLVEWIYDTNAAD